MGRRLAYTVHVSRPGKEAEVFPAGSVPPAWAEKLITNPIAFEDVDVDAEVAATHPGPSETAPAGAAVLAELEAARARIAALEGSSAASSSEAEAGDGPPPKSGAGSSADAWANYAKAHAVDVELDAKREDIVAALEAAGVPTERPEQ